MSRNVWWFNRDTDAPYFPPDVMAEILVYVRHALAYVERRRNARIWLRVDRQRRELDHAKRMARPHQGKKKYPAGRLVDALVTRRRLEALKEAK